MFRKQERVYCLFFIVYCLFFFWLMSLSSVLYPFWNVTQNWVNMSLTAWQSIGRFGLHQRAWTSSTMSCTGVSPDGRQTRLSKGGAAQVYHSIFNTLTHLLLYHSITFSISISLLLYITLSLLVDISKSILVKQHRTIDSLGIRVLYGWNLLAFILNGLAVHNLHISTG